MGMIELYPYQSEFNHWEEYYLQEEENDFKRNFYVTHAVLMYIAFGLQVVI